MVERGRSFPRGKWLKRVPTADRAPIAQLLPSVRISRMILAEEETRSIRPIDRITGRLSVG